MTDPQPKGGPDPAGRAAPAAIEPGLPATETTPRPTTADTENDTEKPPTESFPDEINHLEVIKQQLSEAIQQAGDRVERADREFREVKHYMSRNRGELAAAEMFQNELALRQIDSRGVFAVKTREKLSKLLDSPYFARIDFREAAREKPDPIYIGRFAFRYADEQRISDWRSPVAGMFYDCEPGKAGYNAPGGRIEGELTRKRQFKIKNGQLEYALESALNIQDDVLRRELSRAADEKMKSIIATIQQEQNRLIRNENSGTLLIQGVAGSGKTSIALHRVAYLLYRFKDRLAAQNVTIISPNRVFGDYISSVLPELGEEPIQGISLEDIARALLGKTLLFEPQKDPLENHDRHWPERVRVKSGTDFIQRMDDYLEQTTAGLMEPGDYTYSGFKVESDWIQNRFKSYKRHPVKQRLQMIAEDILSRLQDENYLDEPLPKAAGIFKSLKERLKVKNSLALYKDFYKQPDLKGQMVLPARRTLEWEDVYPYLYFQAAYEGLPENQTTRHLVIDEMQDYTPAQYAVLNILFKCRKTILGDFGQAVNPQQTHTLADLGRLYSDAELVELRKSYRSTFEIISLAGRIGKQFKLEAVERHGEVPEILKCRDKTEELARIVRITAAFRESRRSTLGIILKTRRQAEACYHALAAASTINGPMHLISNDSLQFENGVSVTWVRMAKGLEFDEVVIPAADADNYASEYDRNLLYIACTRALHRLSITFCGELTRLIAE